MSRGDRYVKVVEWSDDDGCFIGSCPELFYGGCHGQDAKQVFAELCALVDDAIRSLEEAGKPLPPPLTRGEFGNLMQRSA